MPAVARPAIPANIVKLTDFGAKGDGTELCTEAFAKAMKAVDPDIELMMMTYSFSNSTYYIDQQLEIAGPYIDYIIARNGGPEFVASTLAKIRAYNEKHGTTIKLTNTEWLSPSASPEPFDDPAIPQFHAWRPKTEPDYRAVLSFRQIRWFYALNGAARLLDYLSYGGEYHLANFNNCVNTAIVFIN